MHIPMKRLLRIFLLLLISGVFADGIWAQSEDRGTVIRATDGASLVLDSGTEVRLAGIACPEFVEDPKSREVAEKIGADPTDFLLYAWRAKMRLEDICYNQGVRIEPDAKAVPGPSGEKPAYVYRGELLVNRVLVEEGFCYVRPEEDFVKKKEFLELEAQARASQKGIWGF
ncbi:MAG: thermonuclease family protein [Candidatus Omnitrophota bacterium]